MTSDLISPYIDDELSLDEKIRFVEQAFGDLSFKKETVSLLEQERRLRAGMVTDFPKIRLPAFRTFSFRWLKPALLAAVAMATFFFLVPVHRTGVDGLTRMWPHRFVVYLPRAGSTAVVGSFTSWRPVPMQKVDASGYWVLDVDLPAGEHHYSYVVDNDRQMPDPTVSAREMDDFGGQNSIIRIDTRI